MFDAVLHRKNTAKERPLSAFHESHFSVSAPARSAIEHLIGDYLIVRAQTQSLAEPLAVEDYGIQSMPDASPTKWHLAHTTWFFETFILKAFVQNYRLVCDDYEYLFNSYYESVGPQFTRAERGLISRPTVEEVYQYRSTVDERLIDFLTRQTPSAEVVSLVVLGLHHEQQHQELLLTDIKHGLSVNPIMPSYCAQTNHAQSKQGEKEKKSPLWQDYSGGLTTIGHNSQAAQAQQNSSDYHFSDHHSSDYHSSDYQGFCFDNELPAHKVYLEPYRLCCDLVTNAEFLDFMEAGGYDNPLFWLSEGWAWRKQHALQHPLYWFQKNGQWWQFTLYGAQPLRMDDPVTHVSYFEAEAFAHWKGCRLPSEAEWEHAATLAQFSNRTFHSITASNNASNSVSNNAQYASGEQGSEDDGTVYPALDGVFSSARFHPTQHSGCSFLSNASEALKETSQTVSLPRALSPTPLRQLFGCVWQWTSSPYTPYPGFRTAEGAVGEYNGKFMCNQWVLRGGSCVTPNGHLRMSYRNFFPATARWQFTGIRLAQDVAQPTSPP
ncbi:ergothioneine biosynthesis protein EgtB [Marinibactrum halimedae]|uniref:Ergothioneine biosynthesis protein EgtB n=1 Tax=Marinibactrum halimedae TaxID=1444977 RepID=A0AA37WQW9_9GAMM|nr:ergothioneine biosynthesis protein EgtB [Marinibactrum halimedae]MCD9460601.1 ergothioneine biosynthesis protein EgtB [Marinibactrum halimedae]GLS27817.1 hypothetical protein GCM10007877_35360 [Marinibactrum halimedae]